MATSTTGAPPCEHTHLFSEALISHTRPSLLSSSPLWICYPIQASPSILDHPLAQTSLCSTLTLIILWIAATATPCKHCFLSLTGLWFLKPVRGQVSITDLVFTEVTAASLGRKVINMGILVNAVHFLLPVCLLLTSFCLLFLCIQVCVMCVNAHFIQCLLFSVGRFVWCEAFHPYQKHNLCSNNWKYWVLIVCNILC